MSRYQGAALISLLPVLSTHDKNTQIKRNPALTTECLAAALAQPGSYDFSAIATHLLTIFRSGGQSITRAAAIMMPYLEQPGFLDAISEVVISGILSDATNVGIRDGVLADVIGRNIAELNGSTLGR